VSYAVACYVIAVASLLLYAGALLRARAALRKALRAERNRDPS
jgi:hypothetical protein